jgi:hypothetical protein
MEGLLHLIADQLPEEHRDLKTWLADKAGRPNPFMDFDIRGLSPIQRSAFYTAARKARDALRQRQTRGDEQGHASEALDRLLRMKESMDRGEPPLRLSDDDKVHPFDGRPIDLSDLWELNTAGESPGPDSGGGRSLTPAHSVVADLGILLLSGAGTAAGVWAGWYFSHSEVSVLGLSGCITVAVAFTSGLTAWVLFGRGRA